jgi:hypothetical protein
MSLSLQLDEIYLSKKNHIGTGPWRWRFRAMFQKTKRERHIPWMTKILLSM